MGPRISLVIDGDVELEYLDPCSSDIVYAAAAPSCWTWAGEPRNGRKFDLPRRIVCKVVTAGGSWMAV